MKTYRIVFNDASAYFIEAENLIKAIEKIIEQEPDYSESEVIKAEEITF